MEVFWKHPRSFAAMGAAPALSYDMTPASSDGEKSSLRLPVGAMGQEAVGAWLLLGGDVYQIESVRPDTTETTVNCLEGIEAFDRDLLYTAPAADVSMGAFIASCIADAFRDQPDEAYAMPYLDIRCSDPTPFVEPDLDNNGAFNLLEYIRRAASLYNVRTTLQVARSSLIVYVRYTPPAQHSIVFDDGHHVLEKQAFGAGAVAKVSVLQAGVIVDWYLAADGSIGTEPPEERAGGGWVLVSVSENYSADKVEEKVRQTFSRNSASHRIEFWSDRGYDVGDRLRIRLNGQVLQGKVDSVRRQSGDSRYYYRSGSLATTLTEKLKGAGL